MGHFIIYITLCLESEYEKKIYICGYINQIMERYIYILNVYHKPGRGLFSCLIS